MIRRCPNGETLPVQTGDSGVTPEGERLELKHLSRGRKRNYKDSVSSGERKRNSLNPVIVRKRINRGLRDWQYGIVYR